MLLSRFYMLLLESDKKKVIKILLKEYPKQKKAKKKYSEIYDILRSKLYRTNDSFIISIKKIEHKDEDGKDVVTYDIFGVDPAIYGTKPSKDIDEGDTYAIDFSTWSTWLGSRVDDVVVEEMGINSFVAHCLYEMTTWGYSEKELKKERKILNDRIKQVEEGKTKMIPHDEVMKMLQNKMKGVKK